MQVRVGVAGGSHEATRVEIVSDPPMAWNVDGEVIGEGPARFEVLPRALEVVVGPDEEEPRKEP